MTLHLHLVFGDRLADHDNLSREGEGYEVPRAGDTIVWKGRDGMMADALEVSWVTHDLHTRAIGVVLKTLDYRDRDGLTWGDGYRREQVVGRYEAVGFRLLPPIDLSRVDSCMTVECYKPPGKIRRFLGIRHPAPEPPR